MSLARISAPVVFAIIAGAGCFGGNSPPAPGGEDPPPGTVMDPPVTKPPLPTPGKYTRGSMQPIFQLTPSAEERRFVDGGVAMQDGDFVSSAGNFTSAASRLDSIGQQIGKERGGAPIDLIAPQDRLRATQIPFRGNPTDVKFIKLANGVRKAYLPLGGDLTTPGNEVAAVDLASNTVTRRIPVGIHPQRIAVHPAGLIFVCNQFSNYITVIDPTNDQVLINKAGKPVEVKTEFYCTDLVFVPRSSNAPDRDEQDLFVANGWRASVLKYSLQVVRNGVNINQIDDVVLTTPTNPVPDSQPTAEITGVGANPFRLSVGQDLRSLYVANFRGGEIAKVDLAGNRVVHRIAINGPVPDIVQANDLVLVPTTTIDRGLPFRNDTTPVQINANPVQITGLDGVQHVAHPGAQFDNTRAYNFEDLRNGLITLDQNLAGGNFKYYTDDISPEAEFAAEQKVLKGALPQAIAVTKDGTKAFLAMSGSDVIQQVSIVGGVFRVVDAGRPLIHTAARPFALALDEAAGELMVADWGGEVLEVFDVATGNRKGNPLNLGYNTAPYPATNIEKGEFLYYNTAWSNNGRKSCASCHWDELLVDGVGYANGATAPTAYHKVPANFNLITTNSYFWNGSFENGTYAALAAAFQTRTNCELIEFGYTEGIASNPNTRVGDPANRFQSGADTQCRPQTVAGSVLPANFAQIGQIINQDNVVRDQVIKQATAAIGGLTFAEVARFSDFYSVSDLRLPPNPLAYLNRQKELDADTAAKITKGETVFRTAGCATCHNPDDRSHPFTDGLNHGRGSNWVTDFTSLYGLDPRLTNAIGAVPKAMQDANKQIGPPDRGEINIHLDPVDFFVPGCFDVNTCLVFEDPALASRGSSAETARLDAIIKVNLAPADRGFMPGNVRGQPQSNTPSLRGIWFQSNFLRHGLAHSLKEAILAPGHPLLGPGENGFAVDALGRTDVHGVTSKLTAADFDALNLYVQAIE